MLALQSVSKTYTHRGRTVKALDNASLEIQNGDFISVVGPSGSGKSTLLLTLGGMLSPASGRVLVDGQSLYDMGTEKACRVSAEEGRFVFQTFNLVPT